MTVKLTPAQLEERRRQLDHAGFQAWLSPIIILLAIYVYRRWLSAFITNSLFTSSKSQEPARGLRLLVRRVSGILSTTYFSEYGPLYIQVLGLFYAGWLFYLTYIGTKNDYMHITKAFGHVAVSQLPFHYLLSLRQTNYSPIAWATGLTHARLNAVHRFFGRTLHVFLVTHAILYLRFFAVMGFLGKRIQDRDVRLGLIALWSFNILVILAMPRVRRKYRKVFYRSHVVLSAVVLPVLWFHVKYSRWYIGQAVVIYILGWISRWTGTKRVEKKRT